MLSFVDKLIYDSTLILVSFEITNEDMKLENYIFSWSNIWALFEFRQALSFSIQKRIVSLSPEILSNEYRFGLLLVEKYQTLFTKGTFKYFLKEIVKKLTNNNMFKYVVYYCANKTCPCKVVWAQRNANKSLWF